jgi:hypothetical protein
LLLVLFAAGTGDEELSGYLSALQAEADALQLSGKGAAADAALTPLAAAAGELLESGEASAFMHFSAVSCFSSFSCALFIVWRAAGVR